MKKLLLILGLSLGLGSTASANTVWTFVDLLLLDDYRENLNLKLFSNKKDCRSAAIEQFIKVTSQNEGIKVIKNNLNDEILIEAYLVDGKGKFDGNAWMYYIACVPSNPIDFHVK